MIVLSPFEVSAKNDDGYRTKDIVTGTKIATPLGETPLSVGVINHELLTDINLNRVTDAVAFTQAGVVNMGRVYYDQEQYTFRGYPGTILRNGVQFVSWTDESSIERVEVAKGPSAILYGFVSPGGVVNYVTKQPFGAEAYSAKATWSSDFGMREEWDLNTPLLGDKVEFRLTGAQGDGATWTHLQTLHETVLTPIVKVNLTPDTTLTYELSYHKRTGPFERIRFFYINKANGFNSVALAPYNSQLGGTVGYDDSASIAPNSWSETTRRRSEVRLEHRFNEHFHFLAIANDDYGNSEGVSQFMNTKAVRDVGYESMLIPPANHILLNIDPVYTHVQVHTQYVEANLLSTFETKYFKSNTLFGISAQRSPDTFAGNGDSKPADAPFGVIDYTLTSPYTVRLSDPVSKRYYTPGTDYHTWVLFNPVSSVYNWQKPDLFVTESFSTLDDKLHILGGLRRETYHSLFLQKYLPQIGALYEVVKGVSLYSLWSKTTEDNGRTKRYNTPRPLSESKGYDIGVKFDFLDSKLTGSVAYFDIHKSNLAVNDPRLTVDYANGLVDDTVTFTPGSESKGVEVSVQYQPTRSFQAIVTYAHVDAKILPGDPNPANDNTPLVYTVPDAVTFFGRYTFRGGPLDKLTIGGGFVNNWGPIYVGSPATDGLHSDGYFLANAFIRYPIKIRDHQQLELQLGMNNIADKRFYMNGGYNPPRETTLSASYKF